MQQEQRIASAQRYIFLLVRAAVLTKCMLPSTSRHRGMSNIYKHVHTSCFVLVQVKDWPACKRWTRKYLRNAYGGRPAVVANYDMAFADYDAYCRGSRDDMPLYLFDSDFAAKAPLLAGDYTVRSRREARSRPMAWQPLHRVRHDGCSGTACSCIVQEDPLYLHCQPNLFHACPEHHQHCCCGGALCNGGAVPGEPVSGCWAIQKIVQCMLSMEPQHRVAGGPQVSELSREDALHWQC